MEPALIFRRLLWITAFGLLLPALEETAQSARGADNPAISRAAFGIPERIPWTSSRVIGSPEPPAPYAVSRLFPKLKFKDIVDLCAAPGTDRLFVAEQAGKIYSFENRATVAAPDLFVDLGKAIPGLSALYGITFHPGFQTNHSVYLCYVLKDGLPDGSRVSRFAVTPSDPPTLDLSSEKVIITWLSGGHNGGCIKFGLDGNLYISTGDAASPNPPDPLQTGQDNKDLLSSILRIDVDHSEPGKTYRVPPDNPFVGRSDSRPEIWAYGLRNPWRMSFDRKTGALWVGDVGWELWEMVYRVEKGGNYGWSIVEGPQSIHPDWPRGPTPISPPIKAHPHSEAASITGGYVYYGQRLPQLYGAYIYGDWVTGKIWALRAEPGQPVKVDELVDTPLQIVCFAEDAAGELLIADYGGGLYQLEVNTAPSTQLSFPRTLSATGLFASTADHQLAAGVVPFAVNAEMWSDGAVAERFIGLPERSTIQTGARNVWIFQTKNEWRYPTNAVLAKTLSLEMERGKPETLRRIETQLLHFDGADWHAYTYRWNDAQTDGTLVDGGGDEAVLDVRDRSIPGGHRTQVWRFHSRTECLRCHNPWVNSALAFTASELNLDVKYQGGSPVCGLQKRGAREGEGAPVVANQLRSFSHIGFFDQDLDERARPRFADPYDTSADVTERARSWLQMNCAHCHREGAGGSVVSHFDYDTPLKEMKAVGRVPSQGTLGLTNAHVITAGDPCASVLYYRVSTSGQGRMPLIGSRIPDRRGLQLLSQWIQQLPADSADAGSPKSTGSDPETAQALARYAKARSSRDGVESAVEFLLAAPSRALALLTFVNGQGDEQPLPELLLAKVAKHPSYQVRDLFERFLPDELRPHKLGPAINPDSILSLQGDPGRGRTIFFREEVQCSRCHRVGGQGRDFGPDLSQIGRKYSRGQVLDQILNPSKSIDPAFVTYQVETKDGSYSGLIVQRTPEELVLKDPDLNLIRIPTAHVKAAQAQQLSAMPEGLLQSMTAQDAADLVAFLSAQH